MQKSVYTPGYAEMCKQLVAARHNAGLSQRDLAARLDVPHSVIAKIENGERRIDVIEFCWFVGACGGRPAEVFDRVLGSTGTPQRRRGAK